MSLRMLVSMILCARVMIGCQAPEPRAAQQYEPLVIGRAFVMDSAILKEERRITVYLPPGYTQSNERYPVLFLLDGGIAEDFHHITGIVQVSVANEIMRPIIVIGIENTERRRNLTGPTQNPEDRKGAPSVGGSAAFLLFLADELIPRVESEYRCSGSRGIIGESLAGLFVVDTFLSSPELFDQYIAVSPSLWWNNAFSLRHAGEKLKGMKAGGKSLYLTAGGIEDNTDETEQLAELVQTYKPNGLTWYYEPLPAEAHHTVFHLGALNALRKLYPVARHH